ncbi:MFS transporter [Paraburkholderia gardini]|uniref:Purine ribonucleoside efflux pump NepI n=1 Tax=Paraburkholderia gardini TaxID=2823469 RepID=A0ABN7QGQ2_9BURK|nr:MFS transporter [Paraburkholderia gardini]CAG4892888.1 Purine ribonucleoside efflux pump NepI [Paraburkholderia gardini]
MPSNHSPQAEVATSLRQWLSAIAVAISAFAFVTAEVLPVGLLPQIAAALGVQSGVAGLMVTVPGVMAAFSAPTLMILAGRLDRRNVLLLLTAVLLASNVVSAASQNLATMLVGRAMLGAALGGFWTLAIAAAARLVQPHDSARATAIILTGIAFATVVGVPFGTFVATLISWRASFLATGGLVAIALVAQAFLVPSLPSVAAVNVTDFISLAHRRQIQLSMLMIALIFGAHFVTFTYIAPLLLQDFTINEMTLLLLAFGVIGFFSNAILSVAATKRLTAFIAGLTALLLCAIVMMMLFEHSRIGESVAMLIWGIALGALPLLFSMWIQRTTADLLEAGSAMFVSVIQVAIAVGSAVGGVIADHAGMNVDFLAGGGLTVVGLLILQRLSNVRHGIVETPVRQGSEQSVD